MHPMDSQVRKLLATDRIERLRGDGYPQGGDLGLARRVVAWLVPAVQAGVDGPNPRVQRAPKRRQQRRAEHDQRNQEHDRQFLG